MSTQWILRRYEDLCPADAMVCQALTLSQTLDHLRENMPAPEFAAILLSFETDAPTVTIPHDALVSLSVDVNV